jgi:hypothetical protein
MNVKMNILASQHQKKVAITMEDQFSYYDEYLYDFEKAKQYLIEIKEKKYYLSKRSYVSMKYIWLNGTNRINRKRFF